jgi:hypothetical protein
MASGSTRSPRGSSGSACCAARRTRAFPGYLAQYFGDTRFLVAEIGLALAALMLSIARFT